MEGVDAFYARCWEEYLTTGGDPDYEEDEFEDLEEEEEYED